MLDISNNEIIVAAAAPLEELNEAFFCKIDDAYINLGSREFLTLESEPSFENAFFITPEPRENLGKVLFVHTSVNCLNNLLSEISDPSYGASKERQDKIESIIIEMITWIQKDDDGELEDDEGKYDLSEAYSLKSNDEFARKKRDLCIKQKYMRELRVVDCICDILYMPFVSGFKFEEIT